VKTQKSNIEVICNRCRRPLRIAESRRKNSKPFRLAKTPDGVCPDCVMTQFLYNTYPINMQIDEAGPELLLKPGVCEAFEASGLLNGCDLTIGEINWQRVVDNWNLPVAINKKDPRNPYRMGDSPRAGKGKNGDLPPLGFSRAEPGLPAGVRMSGGTVIVDAEKYRANRGPKGDSSGFTEALDGLLKALDKPGKPQ
jgi:hypothetical protein